MGQSSDVARATVRIATAPKVNEGVRTWMFGPLIVAAREQARSERRSGERTVEGPLAATLRAGAVGGHTLTEAALRQAVKTELGLRHGCVATKVTPVAAAGSLLAVQFEADVIWTRSGDPIDVLAFEPVTGCADQVLQCMRYVVSDMLTALSPRWNRMERATMLNHTVADLQRLAEHGLCDMTLAERMLWERVCAANIALCVRTAAQSG